MKIIHLSDTHVGYGENEQRFGRVAEDLIARPPDAPARCLVLHTGDLIHRATAGNREAGRRTLDRLRDAGYRVILCPGNHDYGDSFEVNSEAARTFRREFASYLFHDEPQEFPVVHRLEGDRALIGLDSNAAELNWLQRFSAEGHVGEPQLQRLNRLLDREDLAGKQIVLYLHHHPFYYGYSVMPDVGDRQAFKHLIAWLTRPFRRMKDAYSLCQTVRDRVQAVLFGHMHEGLDCSGESAKYGIPLALDGSSTTDTDGIHDRLRYRIIDLAAGTHTVRMLNLAETR